MSMNVVNIKADKISRVDLLCAERTNYSRNKICKLIKQGLLSVDGKIVDKPSFVVNIGSNICVQIPDDEGQNIVLPENTPIDIIYEDNDILIINKQEGVIVHPSNNINSGTLVNSLLYHVKTLSNLNGDNRPGIVHRLDKDTSGIIIVAKNNKAHDNIAKQIKEHKVKKYYVALVNGNFRDDIGKIIKPIARDKINRKKMAIDESGRYAETHWQKLLSTKDTSLILVRIITGRTHQIRVHMKSVSHPVIGDKIYSKVKKINTRLMLHAYRIEFEHPSNNKKLEFIAVPNTKFISDLAKYGYNQNDVYNTLNNLDYKI